MLLATSDAPVLRKRGLAHTAAPENRTLVVSDISNAPDYMPGDVCLTEPCSEPQHGRMMVARLPKLGITIFAACIVAGADFELVPLKEGYPTFSSATDVIELLGVAVEHHRDLRNR